MHTVMIDENDLSELEKSKGQIHTGNRTEARNAPLHPDCTTCPAHLKRGHCDRYHHCKPWLLWFAYEWRKIRAAAENIRINRNKSEQRRKPCKR